MNIKKFWPFIVILCVFAINLSFGFPRLSQYSSVDEPYWSYDRTPDFWKAIKEKKWERTDINDKPGITVAQISGIGLLSGINPLQHKSFRQEAKSPQLATETVRINFFLRLPIYLVSLLILLAFYFFLRKLFDQSVAIIALIFIGLSPIILGVSLIINPDSLLWGFLPLSILSYLISQKEPRERKYLIFSGIFLGLSLLTKYVANILYVYLLGLVFLEYIYSWKKDRDFSVYIRKALLDYGILVLVSLATFFLLYPNCWVNPETLLKGTVFSAAFKSTWPLFAGFLGLLLADIFALQARFSSAVINFIAKYRQHFKLTVSVVFLIGIAFVFANTYSGMQVFDFESEMASPKGEKALSLAHILKIVSTDIYGLVFGLTPIVLFFFIYGIFKNITLRNEIRKETATVSYLLIFILLYYLASTLNQVTATVRYQIVTYPMAAIVAALGLSGLIQTEKFQKYLKKTQLYVILLFFSFLSLFSVAPHFFNYSSALLTKNYILNLKDMGDGSFEVATFLNSLPNANQMLIWSDKGAVCETFLGKCNVGFNKNDTTGKFDYFVLSSGRKSRSLKLEQASDFKPEIDFPKGYADGFSEADFRINFNGNYRNFVRVIKSDKILEIEK